MAYLTSFARKHSHLSWLNIAGYRPVRSTSVSMVLSDAYGTITWEPSLRLLQSSDRMRSPWTCSRQAFMLTPMRLVSDCARTAYAILQRPFRTKILGSSPSTLSSLSALAASPRCARSTSASGGLAHAGPARCRSELCLDAAYVGLYPWSASSEHAQEPLQRCGHFGYNRCSYGLILPLGTDK